MDITDIRLAQERIRPFLKRTPLERSETLSRRLGTNVFVKYELFQRTGSFKARGAFNKLLSLSDEERSRGVVAVSGGNHAQAVAYASSVLGVDSVIIMPESTPRNYVDATRGYGGMVVFEPSTLTVFQRAQALVDELGYTFIPPFDHPAIVAGQGTVGLEILEDLPDVGTIVVPIGGGGLIAGVALAIKSQRPSVRIVGVEPEGAAAMWRSRQEGKAVRLDKVDTIADGLSAPFAGEVPFAIVQQYVDDLVLVSDADIRAAMILLLERCKLLVEPGGAAGVAALLSGAVKTQPGAPVVAVLSGGNVDAGRLAKLLVEPTD